MQGRLQNEIGPRDVLTFVLVVVVTVGLCLGFFLTGVKMARQWMAPAAETGKAVGK